MNNVFIYYLVNWTSKNEIKQRKFYDKKSALNWKSVLKAESNPVVRKITETTEIIK